MDTILITGGSGFVGTNLIDYFLSKNISNIINVLKINADFLELKS